jgi:hypothetical protein
MRDHSNGKYGGLAVVWTQEGFQVGKVGRRATDQQIVVKQYVGLPSEKLEDALASLDEIHSHNLELHLIGSLVALAATADEALAWHSPAGSGPPFGPRGGTL